MPSKDKGIWLSKTCKINRSPNWLALFWDPVFYLQNIVPSGQGHLANKSQQWNNLITNKNCTRGDKNQYSVTVGKGLTWKMYQRLVAPFPHHSTGAWAQGSPCAPRMRLSVLVELLQTAGAFRNDPRLCPPASGHTWSSAGCAHTHAL